VAETASCTPPNVASGGSVVLIESCVPWSVTVSTRSNETDNVASAFTFLPLAVESVSVLPAASNNLKALSLPTNFESVS
jgi:hypothetical protein